MIAAFFLLLVRIIKRVAGDRWPARRMTQRYGEQCSDAEPLHNRVSPKIGRKWTDGEQPGCSRLATEDTDSQNQRCKKNRAAEMPSFAKRKGKAKGKDTDCEIKKVTPLKIADAGPTGSMPMKTPKGKTPQKGILVSRCKAPTLPPGTALGCTGNTVQTKSVTISLPEESGKHSPKSRNKSRSIKHKERVSSVGYTMSREAKLKTDIFWLGLPLVQREYYAHEHKTGSRDGWGMLFRELQIDSFEDLQNRPTDLMTCEHSRVNRIDVSHVRLDEVGRRYLITQGPTCNTMVQFWKMVWEMESVGIVMLSLCFEDGNKETRATYCPSIGGDPVITGIYVIECTESEWKTCYCVSTLKMHNLDTEEARTILHFQYFSWSRAGVPQDPLNFLEFLMEVRDCGVMMPGVGPVVVHCSSGRGRSGVFTVSDACISWLEGARSMSTLDVKIILRKMREQRPGLIQTKEQLQFVYVTALNAAHYALELGPNIPDLEKYIQNFTESVIDEEMNHRYRPASAHSPSPATQLVPAIYPPLPSTLPRPLESLPPAIQTNPSLPCGANLILVTQPAPSPATQSNILSPATQPLPQPSVSQLELPPATQPDSPTPATHSEPPPATQSDSPTPATHSEPPPATQPDAPAPATHSEPPPATQPDAPAPATHSEPRPATQLNPSPATQPLKINMSNPPPAIQPENSPPPATQPESPAPATQPDSPAPATQPDSPATQPESPATQPDSPATQPDSPATQPDSPATQPDSPATQPDSPATQLESPGLATQPDSPATQSDSPATQPDSPATQLESPGLATQLDSPATQPDSPATQPDSPATQQESSSIQPAPAVTQPATQPESPAIKPAPAVTQPESPATQLESPVIQPESPATQPESPATQQESPAIQPESPAPATTQQESLATQPESPANQIESSPPATQLNSPHLNTPATQPPPCTPVPATPPSGQLVSSKGTTTSQTTKHSKARLAQETEEDSVWMYNETRS